MGSTQVPRGNLGLRPVGIGQDSYGPMLACRFTMYLTSPRLGMPPRRLVIGATGQSFGSTGQKRPHQFPYFPIFCDTSM